MDPVVVWWSFAVTWRVVWGHVMDLVVVWWSFAVTGRSSGAECHLGLVLGHLMDLVEQAFFLYMFSYVYVYVYVLFLFSYKCVLVSSRLVCLVLSRFVLSRLVL